MRLLITGITGFVGGYLADYLLTQADYQLWGLTRGPGRLPPNLAGRVNELYADLDDPAALRRALELAQPELIFHLAGQPFVPESFRDPGATLQTNLLGTLHIIQALIALQLKPRLLLVGSYEEYGNIAPHDLPISEACPLRPTNPYGVSKAAQSLLAMQYHMSHGLDALCVRPFTHIGPGQSARFVTAAFARQIARIEHGLQPPLVQVGNLSAQRDFTDVRDIVRAYALLAQHGNAGQVYNVGSGQAVTVQSILDHFVAASTTTVEVQPNPELMRPIDMPLVLCDARRLRDATGWVPNLPLSQTLNDILNYWRDRVLHEEAGST
ncbi:GDP-mannose 4,6-dehydratase [Candidatus Viridilinea mediisalina]|uniref:GDP-mannose 4,6-dehydratase n=1 Tax=Candidatus Viridilinea mediisalina TaxID=2024553 RepID=A0A2A6RN22_9CHLR|nr:GDP-mannose 4,6-dehydratase [Candidatus Viridilinea mediisalina]PDW04437.1 GDP-mannose 4,6-dehydratase [Candidatus Viridilinea mediisalina]